MAKISPVSIKYMIHANFTAEGALEKPDVIGAIFGQTEGLLGAELEMRELQKEGKIGRIEVELERRDKMTTGKIMIPTALDQSETTLIAAAIETIERIGPSDAQIEIARIEDVRGSKRDYILERAKKLMSEIKGSTDSREISNEIKDSAKTSSIQEYGDEKLPCGNISGREIIVVEGRADVVNLLRAGVTNVIAMNGTKMPNAIRELGKEKEITLFVDGDRGGKLIIQNVSDNANIDYIVVAPDGKEVEELAGKEILMILRRKTPLNEFLRREGMQRREQPERTETPLKKKELNEEEKEKLKKILKANEDSGKAILLDESLREIREISARGFGGSLRRVNEKPYAIVLDGTVTSSVIEAAEDAKCQVLVARNFAATSNNIQLLSF
ncbi:MAG: DNA primase DnaG [Vicinamibacterales bacterium]|jgi:DNA primase